MSRSRALLERINALERRRGNVAVIIEPYTRADDGARMERHIWPAWPNGCVIDVPAKGSWLWKGDYER